MGSEPRAAAYRLIWIAVLFWVVAGGTYLARRAAYGDRPAAVHVRWASTVDDVQRQRLERTYSLTAPEPTEGRTFGYALTDLSRTNIRALVLDPAVEDTHEIHRTEFRVGYLSPRLPYSTPYPSIPKALDAFAVLCLVVGTAWTAVRGRTTRLASWIGTRIPEASPQAAALFRVVFGASLLLLVLRETVDATWAAEPSNVISPLHRLLLRPFVQAPWLVDGLSWWIAFWGGLFVVGAIARVAFAFLTTGVFAWALLYTTSTTYHTISALLVSLIVLQWARWSDAWSIAAWKQGRNVSSTPTREYGYTTWIPGMVLGVVFAAAAVSKLRDSGIAWIANGTVKYHFLSDSGQAIVDWGLWIGRHPWLSVLLSFGAIALESFVLVGVLMGAYRYRLLAGAAALSLLLGFLLLQGLFWSGWWILLLSFLPWHLVGAQGSQPGDGAPSVHAAAPRPIVFVVMALIAVQLTVSFLRLEVSPLLSSYDMYATTYGSPAEYEQKAGEAYWIVGVDDSAQAHRCRITRAEADLLTRAVRPQAGSAQAMLRRCFDSSVYIRNMSVEATRTRIDWSRWERLDEPLRTPLTGTIPVESVQ